MNKQSSLQKTLQQQQQQQAIPQKLQTQPSQPSQPSQPQQIVINKKKPHSQMLDKKNSHKAKKQINNTSINTNTNTNTNISSTTSNSTNSTNITNGQNTGGKQKNRPLSVKNIQRVNFNLKNNQVEKFYCPQMVMTKMTKAKPIDLNLIPDLPEIPLDSLFGN